MPRNRPTPSSDRRLLADSAASIAYSIDQLSAQALRLAASLTTGRPVDTREAPLAEYRGVSQLGLSHLGRWVAILGGTYHVPADPVIEREASFAATYGVVQGPAAMQTVAGRLVGILPSSKAAPAGESLGYRSLVIQQGSLTTSREIWAGRPVFVAPRDLS